MLVKLLQTIIYLLIYGTISGTKFKVTFPQIHSIILRDTRHIYN